MSFLNFHHFLKIIKNIFSYDTNTFFVSNSTDTSKHFLNLCDQLRVRSKLTKCGGSEVLPVQEVVFVKVRDASSNFTGHPLQLQQVSVSERPVLLRQKDTQIPLQRQNTHSTISPPKSKLLQLKSYFIEKGVFFLNAMCRNRHTGAAFPPCPVFSALLMMWGRAK